MYRIDVRYKRDNSIRRMEEVPECPTELEIRELMKFFPSCYVDICRLAEDPLSDTMNFREDVEFDLEPLELI